jgi:hypothetical protein
MMMRVKPVVILSLMLMTESAFAQDNDAVLPAVIELSRRGNSAVVVLRSTGEDVFLPACRGVVWERFVQTEGGGAGRYVSLPAESCGPAKPPGKVSKDGVEFTVPQLEESGSVVVRAVAVVGVGCAPDRPMVIGNCNAVFPLKSSTITIRADGSD